VSSTHFNPSWHSTPQDELKKDLLRMRREKERSQAAAQQATQAAAAAAHNQQQHTLAHKHGITPPHHLTVSGAPSHKRKREEERETASPTKSKKKKMISTTSTKESKKEISLYCVCKTPYDETKYDNDLWSTLELKYYITLCGRHRCSRPSETQFKDSPKNNNRLTHLTGETFQSPLVGTQWEHLLSSEEI